MSFVREEPQAFALERGGDLGQSRLPPKISFVRLPCYWAGWKSSSPLWKYQNGEIGELMRLFVHATDAGVTLN